jgi:flavin-dependent dehydrogenase
MTGHTKYDVAIVGGGLAGLALAIQVAKEGYRVILFEKEGFPFHKVCGEYISMESWNFLEGLGIPLSTMNLPRINELQLTAPNGSSLNTGLPLGGFGISRYLLDASLAVIARNSGVVIMEKSRVEAVEFKSDFAISYKPSGEAGLQVAEARVCCAAYGKRSNLDIKWNRNFLKSTRRKTDNYVGIKYHITTPWKNSLIGLHNFKDGYCGISKIEGDTCCLCYMTRAENLKLYKGDIKKMETEVLHKNIHLKKIFSECTVLADFPVSISQINFNKKNTVENGTLMLGDAAGTIPPLCGNGMSMALHSSKMAAPVITAFLAGAVTRAEMEKKYTKAWNKAFAVRLAAGQTIQYFFGRSWLTNTFVFLFKAFPFLASFVIKQTHGKPF